MKEKLTDLLPEPMKGWVSSAKGRYPHLFQMDEQELRKELGYRVPPTVNMLRLALWSDYHMALSQGRGLQPEYSLTNVAPWSTVELVCQRPEWVAFMLLPPASYESCLEESLQMATQRVREILDLPLRDEKGRVNVKLADLMLKIYTVLDLRKHGAPTQRIEQRTAMIQVGKMEEALSVEELDKAIAQIEAKSGDTKPSSH